jgi:hypothetical protein
VSIWSSLVKMVSGPLRQLAVIAGAAVAAEYGSEQAEQIIERLPDEFVHAGPQGHRIIGVAVGPVGAVNLESFLRRTAKLARAEAEAIARAAKHG